MKNMKIFIAVMPFLISFILGCGEIQRISIDYDEPRNTFSDLDLYGQWINVPALGNVWRPNVSSDWRPYSSGQWEWTNNGWMWLSDEPYSWIIYHYGFWAFTDADRWVWIPQYEWSSSRVSWIADDDYVGWAPLSPPGWSLPRYFDDNADRIWIVVHTRDFANRDIIRYRITDNSLRSIGRNSGGQDRGPDINAVRHITNSNFDQVNIQTERIRSGKRNLTRIRIPNNNQQSNNPALINDRNNFTPPPVGRVVPQTPETSRTRTNDSGRNAIGNPPETKQLDEKKDLVAPRPPADQPVDLKHKDEKNNPSDRPIVRQAPTRNANLINPRTPVSNDSVVDLKRSPVKITDKKDDISPDHKLKHMPVKAVNKKAVQQLKPNPVKKTETKEDEKK